MDLSRENHSSKIEEMLTTSETSDKGNSSHHAQSSRYKDDYVQLKQLGQGGFGCVMQVRNKLDQQEYAVKLVNLPYPLDQDKNKQVEKEAKLLARLNHENVVRYYSSWIETGVKKSFCREIEWSIDNDDVQEERDSGSSEKTDEDDSDSSQISFLFIQMELCSKTLRLEIDEAKNLDPNVIARYFFEIVNGLKYIHQQGLSHRDLNPNNIFLNAEGNLKIGDFGLAIERLSGPRCGVDTVCSSLSKDVGTHLYRAPEVNSKHYDNRVDLYSLGIILFEMLYPMETSMERRKVLEELRSLEISFPGDFSCDDSSWQMTVLMSLLSHAAGERMALDDILNILVQNYPSLTKIPELMDQVLLDPSSAVYKQVLDSYFKKAAKSCEDIAFDFPKHSYDTRTHFCVNSIVRCIESIFQKHGAIHVSTPLLMPCDISNQPESVVKLLTRDGLVVNLPHYARNSFARFVVWSGISHMTRYDTLQTYKEHSGGNHPRPLYECVFDIITPRQGSLGTDAYILQILVAVCKAIPWKGRTISHRIYMNHTGLVKAVLLSIGVQSQHLNAALELIGLKGYDGLATLEHHKLKSEAVDFEKLHRILKCWDNRGNKKLQLLQEIDGDCKKMAENAMEDLKKISQFCHDFGIQDFSLSLRLVNNVNYYSGVFFSTISVNEETGKKITIADGGRYDDILESLSEALSQEKPDISRQAHYGIGLSIYPTKVLKIQQEFWPPELVVVTCRKNECLEKQAHDLSEVLRNMNINCRVDFDVEARDIKACMADENVLCVVECLPCGFTNITHKFVGFDADEPSMISVANPVSCPPTIKVASDLDMVIKMITLNIDVAM